jgi:hypothetical protein
MADDLQDYDWLFAEARRLFNEGDDRDAKALLELLLTMPGGRRDAVVSYLDQIDKRRPPAPPPARAPKIAPAVHRGIAPYRAAHGAEPECAPAAAGEFRRTPHLDLPAAPLAPGARAAVTVRIDIGPATPGTVVTPLLLAGDPVTVRIVLKATEHFVLEDGDTRELIVQRDLEQQAADPYQLRVRPLDEIRALGPAVLMATFFDGARPCGRITREVPVAGLMVAGVPPQRPTRPLTIDPNAGDADLTITVSTLPINDGRQFDCLVQSPLHPALTAGVTGTWNLPEVAAAIVARHMARFTARGMTSRQRVAALRGAGKEFFRVAPAVFKQAYWTLVDSGQRPRHIAIISDEPHIPWELMIPSRKVGALMDSEDALGAQYAIGRWVGSDGSAPPQMIPLTSSSIVAPRYVGARALRHAATEAAAVAQRFAGDPPVSPVTFETVESHIRERLGQLLHIACHGRDDDGSQSIELEEAKSMTSTELAGMDGAAAAFSAKRPLVFLNACEVGRTSPALVGARGFAKEFADLGASAIVAPLWSVKDDIAHEIAMSFYDRVSTEPSVSFAEILRDIRGKAYDLASGEDTYAAYCFYGDPRAVARLATLSP